MNLFSPALRTELDCLLLSSSCLWATLPSLTVKEISLLIVAEINCSPGLPRSEIVLILSKTLKREQSIS